MSSSRDLQYRIARLLSCRDCWLLLVSRDVDEVGMPRLPDRAAGRLIGSQVVEEQHVPSAIGGQMGQHPGQVKAGTAMPDQRHPQRPVTG